MKSSNQALLIIGSGAWSQKVSSIIGKNNKETWDKILADGGSVQGLDFLDDYITLAGTFLVDTNEENKESKAEYYSNPAHIPLKMVQSITYIDVPADIVALMLSDFNTRGFNAD